MVVALGALASSTWPQPRAKFNESLPVPACLRFAVKQVKKHRAKKARQFFDGTTCSLPLLFACMAGRPFE